MNADEIQNIASLWIKWARTPEGSLQREQFSEAFEQVWDLGFSEPETVWLIILKILECDESMEVLQVLSAGPLEDLLVRHGPIFIERIEREASAKPMFRKLLGGVWKRDMNDDIWLRVQNSWDRRGWDEIPK